MATLAHKIIVFAAVDGLVLQPLPARGSAQRASPVKIRYRDGAVVRDPHASYSSNASRTAKPTSGDDSDVESTPSFEAFGIIGLLRISHLSFLISITRRLQVATILGHPIYVITDVAVTPCASRKDAETSVAETAALLRERKPPDLESTDSSDDSETDSISLARMADEMDDIDDVSAKGGNGSGNRITVGAAGSSGAMADDVMSRNGTYGRFAQRWFSREGWLQERKRSMGVRGPLIAASGLWQPQTLFSELASETSHVDTAAQETAQGHPLPDQPTTSALLPKLLRTTQMLFGTSRSFFFSFGIDLTRPLANRPILPPTATVPGAPESPLHIQADPTFFWNHHLLQPFLSTNQNHQSVFALPVIQGFIGQRTFVANRAPTRSRDPSFATLGTLELSTLDLPPAELPAASSSPPPPENEKRESESQDLRPFEKQFTMTLNSRRSTQRAGLRYLRRGVDEDGHAANFVETEQILSSARWESGSKMYSLVQVRGSIPLFFTQSPYSIKPAPVLQHSSEANFQACKKHFDWLQRRWGDVCVVNLVEKHGVEARIGEEYRRKVQRIAEEAANSPAETSIPFEWFDFHAVCRGMKFERVSLLLDALQPTLREFGYSTRIIGGSSGGGSDNDDTGAYISRQTGVVRTNCMDCLDRTNVCQSSFAKHVLETQLQEEGFDADAQTDGSDMAWFNGLWADNGDAISQQYAATAAMKGDYTRTRKRDYRGAWNDLGLGLSRFYHGMVNDYFSQAAIDFLLGNVTSLVFEEFEADMMTKDSAVPIPKLREQAIDLCRRRVIADDTEEFAGGWVLLSPTTPGSIKTLPLEEVVLLLTDGAVYVCRFDWVLDKVREFERIDLASVTKVKFGTYVTSTVTRAQMDEGTNVGLVIDYVPGRNDVRRKNTRTLKSMDKEGGSEKEKEKEKEKDKGLKRDNETTGGWPDPIKAPSFTGLMMGGGRSKGRGASSRLALKAPYAQSSMMKAGRGVGTTIGIGIGIGTGDGARHSEMQLVGMICAEVDRLAAKRRLEGTGTETGAEMETETDESVLEKGDIVSLEEARRNTGLLEQLGYSIKKMIWAS